MAIRSVDVSSLAGSFAGDVVLPANAGYDEARRVWNGMIDRRPALIVRPTSVADVAAAIRFGREHDLVIAVRGGGHSLPGLSTCDDGLVIDLSRMRGVTVDPANRVARAHGGALLTELDRAAQAHGLVCPVGVVGHTGVAGLTLGGGMGRLQRRFGLTIDNLLAVELVTADGRSVRASATDNPELFWGMRGAGANFGVVTAFEFRLHPLAPTVTRGNHVYPASRMAEVWPMFRDFAASAPDYMHLAINVGLAVPEADYLPSIAGQPIVTFGYFHSGAVGEVDRDLAPLSSIAPGELVTRYEQPYLEVQGLFDEPLGWGHRDYSKGGFANYIPVDAWNRLTETVVEGPAGAVFGVWAQGGQMARADETDTAFTGRSALFDISADVTWDDPQADSASVTWVRQAMAIMEPYTVTGRYINEQSDTSEQVARESYGTVKYARLVALKRTWDPDNVFRLNQNIRPG